MTVNGKIHPKLCDFTTIQNHSLQAYLWVHASDPMLAEGAVDGHGKKHQHAVAYGHAATISETQQVEWSLVCPVFTPY